MRVRRESVWTDPTALCPHPERWTAIDAQSAEMEVAELIGGFVRALQPDYVIETGTAIGLTASMIGGCLKANGHGRLDTLEIDPQRAALARTACNDLPVTIHQSSSLEFTPVETIGFAWLDSETDLRIPEFDLYRPWMKVGTVVGVHDTSPHFGSWSEALFSLPGTRAIRLPTPRGVTFIEVTE